MADSALKPTRPLPDLARGARSVLQWRAAGTTSSDRRPKVIALRPSRLRRLMQAIGLR